MYVSSLASTFPLYAYVCNDWGYNPQFLLIARTDGIKVQSIWRTSDYFCCKEKWTLSPHPIQREQSWFLIMFFFWVRLGFSADFCSFRRGNTESCIRSDWWSTTSSVLYIVWHFGGYKQTPFPAQLNLEPFEGCVVPLSYNLSPNTGQKNKWATYKSIPGLLFLFQQKDIEAGN